MLKDILSAIFSIFKSKKVTQADCQVYFDRIADSGVDYLVTKNNAW